MFEKYGEFDSAEEINEAVKAQLEEGDTDAILEIAMENGIDTFTQMLWENLNPDNKISLFVRYTDLETRQYEQRIINKHQ